MARRRSGFHTQAPKEVTWAIAAILWLVGVLDLLFHAVTLPPNYAVYALVLAGLLLLVGATVDGV